MLIDGRFADGMSTDNELGIVKGHADMITPSGPRLEAQARADEEEVNVAIDELVSTAMLVTRNSRSHLLTLTPSLLMIIDGWERMVFCHCTSMTMGMVEQSPQVEQW